MNQLTDIIIFGGTIMDKAYIAFYRSFCNGSTIVDWTIGLATFSNYSHVEIYMSDNKSLLSVSPRSNGITIRKAAIDRLLNNDNWDIVEIDVDSIENIDANILEVVSMYSDKRYDYFGAIFSAFSFIDWFCGNSKVFCSEVVHEVVFGKAGACNYSPRRLFWKLIRERNGKIL